MKRKSIKGILAGAMTVVLTVALPFVVFAGTQGIDNGRFTDLENLTWTTWDGVSTTYGRGPKFSDVRPDVMDPEYFLKEVNLLESGTYAPEIVAELRTFVNSFDWIHSDELTRANMVHDRVSNGYHGNVYKYPEGSWYSVLMTGTGQCRDFSGEFKSLAKFVGLECEVYTPSDMHQACLVKISGQWFASDPTSSSPFLSNSKTYPVDYETEYNRYANEYDAKWNAYYIENPDSTLTLIAEANQKTYEGIITEDDWARVNPLFVEIDTQLMNKTITAEEYEAKNVEILKSLLGK